MKIDGVSLVEPSATDDPYAMGPVAVVIDIDLEKLAQKVWVMAASMGVGVAGDQNVVLLCSGVSGESGVYARSGQTHPMMDIFGSWP